MRSGSPGPNSRRSPADTVMAARPRVCQAESTEDPGEPQLDFAPHDPRARLQVRTKELRDEFCTFLGPLHEQEVAGAGYDMD